MIVLQVDAGLCNRLRAIHSAVILAEKLDRPLHVCWRATHDCGAPFEDLFQQTPAFVVNSEEGKRIMGRYESPQKHSQILRGITRLAGQQECLRDIDDLYFYNKYGGKLMDEPFERLAQRSVIYIRTVHSFLYGREIDYLQPNPDSMQKIEAITDKYSDHTIGIQIRRCAYKPAARSPYELFLQFMRNELDRLPQTKFFIATDCSDTKSRLKAEFGECVLENPDVVFERDSISGLQSAVVDLWCLSRTNKVMGTAASSFGEFAALIGGVPLERLEYPREGERPKGYIVRR